RRRRAARARGAVFQAALTPSSVTHAIVMGGAGLTFPAVFHSTFPSGHSPLRRFGAGTPLIEPNSRGKLPAEGDCRVIPSGVFMRFGRVLPASLLAAALALPCASLARANIVVTIDKTTQQMSV